MQIDDISWKCGGNMAHGSQGQWWVEWHMVEERFCFFNTFIMFELSVRSLKEGRNCGFDPSSLRRKKKFYHELNSSLCIIAYFESWVNLLRSILSSSQNLRELHDSK